MSLLPLVPLPLEPLVSDEGLRCRRDCDRRPVVEPVEPELESLPYSCWLFLPVDVPLPVVLPLEPVPMPLEPVEPVVPVVPEDVPVPVPKLPLPVEPLPVEPLPVGPLPVPLDPLPIPLDSREVPLPEWREPLDSLPVPLEPLPIPLDPLPGVLDPLPMPLVPVPAPLVPLPAPLVPLPVPWANTAGGNSRTIPNENPRINLFIVMVHLPGFFVCSFLEHFAQPAFTGWPDVPGPAEPASLPIRLDR